MRLSNEKAAHMDSIRLQSPNIEANGVHFQNGLGSNHTASVIHRPCRLWVCSVIMPATRRTTGRDHGRSLYSYRRMTAAPSCAQDVAFSFGVVRTHGLIAPALRLVCGLMPCGNPSGLPLPVARSANPHGVAHLMAGVSGIQQFATGASHEC